MYFFKAPDLVHGPSGGTWDFASLDAHLTLSVDDLQRYMLFQLEIITS